MMVASMAEKGSRVIDCGCDHGLVPIWLVQNDIAVHVTAADISEGPLSAARRNIGEAGLSDRIDILLSDGITECTPGLDDTLLIAGMGGPLMLDILERSTAKTSSFSHFIFQPQSAIEDFRKRIRQLGMKIICEKNIFEGGKYYAAMSAVYERDDSKELYERSQLCSDKQQSSTIDDVLRLYDRYGRSLLEGADPVLLSHIRREMKMYKKIYADLSRLAVTDKSSMRMQEVRILIDDCSRALNIFYGNQQ